VTGEMWKNKPPFRLCLNKAASDEIHWHCKHYTGRGVMKFYENGAELAKDMGIPVQTLIDEHDQHYEAAKKTEKDPDGGSYPAYPSGKSWDARSGPTGSGKKFYHNIIPGSAVATEPFYVAIITPVIHYCMGGLEIDESSRVLDEKRKVIPGLYAAGEVAGGVHGNNRLGGNSLLDCVVFGRVAAEDCAKYMLGDALKQVDLKEIHKLPSRIPAAAPTEAAGSAAPKAEAKAAPAKKDHVTVNVNAPEACNHPGVGVPGSAYFNADGYRTGIEKPVTQKTYEERLGMAMKVLLGASGVFCFLAINYWTPGAK